MINNGFREKLAALEHEQWATLVQSLIEYVPEERRERWQRLIDTDYKDLTEEEKDQDRVWSNKVIELIKEYYS